MKEKIFGVFKIHLHMLVSYSSICLFLSLVMYPSPSVHINKNAQKTSLPQIQYAHIKTHYLSPNITLLLFLLFQFVPVIQPLT